MYNPQPQWVPQARQYEFGHYENSVFGDVAKWMTVAAVVNVLGMLTPLHVEGTLGGVLTLVVSLLLWMGASAFRRVVSTQGNDVTHLMEALDDYARRERRFGPGPRGADADALDGAQNHGVFPAQRGKG